MAIREGKPIDYKQALLEAWAVNCRITEMLVEGLDERAWRVPTKTVGINLAASKGRTIAAIVAHIHNVRHMWLEVSAKGSKIPPKLDRSKVTRPQAIAALRKSGEACAKLMAAALARPDGKVKDFRPDAVGMFGYMLSHDAHHRGQISMLARQAGYPLPQNVHFGMWEWGKLWQSCGFSR